MSRRSVVITGEQAIYGSFPFWDKGYALLARSPCCQSEWAAEFTRLCQSLGQPPSEANPEIDRLLFAARMRSGLWVIALGSAQGCDDRGRPGAWAFHGLFLSHADYKKTGAWPFAFLPCFQTQFQLNQTLDKFQLKVETDAELSNTLVSNQTIKPEWMKFIRRRNYLRIHQENTTIDQFRVIWEKIPGRERARNSMTTMLFRPSGDFNIAAIKPVFKPVDQPAQAQKLIAISFDELFQNKTVDSNNIDIKQTIRKILFGVSIRKIAISIGLCVISLVCLVRCNFNEESSPEMSTNQPSFVKELPPDTKLFQMTVEKPDLVHAIREHLIDWSDRLHLDPVDSADSEIQISQRILAAIRYQGPFISEEIDDQLPEAAQVKQMDTLIKKYTQFRQWPDDQTGVNLSRLALANLAWAVSENRLSDQARNLNSAADVRVWFAELRHRLFRQELLLLSQPCDAESQFPELVEYRLHFSRLSALVEK